MFLTLFDSLLPAVDPRACIGKLQLRRRIGNDDIAASVLGFSKSLLDVAAVLAVVIRIDKGIRTGVAVGIRDINAYYVRPESAFIIVIIVGIGKICELACPLSDGIAAAAVAFLNRDDRTCPSRLEEIFRTSRQRKCGIFACSKRLFAAVFRKLLPARAVSLIGDFRSPGRAGPAVVTLPVKRIGVNVGCNDARRISQCRVA